MEKQQGKTPQIRFPEFKNQWEHRKLSDFLSESKLKNTDLKYDKDEVLSVSGELGIVNQIEHLGRSYAGESVHNYGVVETGDIVYTKSPLKANPFGIIKLNKGKAGIVSTLYAVYKVNHKNAFGAFIDYYFSLDANTNRYLRPLVKKGAKNDMKINNAYVLHDRIFAPTIEEQKRIASFLTVLDKKIAQLKQKKTLFEHYKKGVMQKLFSQELRFKDENGNEFPKWEKTTLGKISERVTEKNVENNLNVLTISAQEGLISQLEFFNNSVSSNTLTGYYLLKTDDFAYNRSSSNGYPIGAIKRLKRYNKGVVSTLYICFKFKNKVDSNFYEHYFESGICNREIEAHVKEGARNHGLLNIGLTDFFGISIYEPCEKEKIRITEFMCLVDKKLQSCNSQLELMIEFKRGLIQKMYCI